MEHQPHQPSFSSAHSVPGAQVYHSALAAWFGTFLSIKKSFTNDKQHAIIINTICRTTGVCRGVLAGSVFSQKYTLVLHCTPQWVHLPTGYIDNSGVSLPPPVALPQLRLKNICISPELATPTTTKKLHTSEQHLLYLLGQIMFP